MKEILGRIQWKENVAIGMVTGVVLSVVSFGYACIYDIGHKY